MTTLASLWEQHDCSRCGEELIAPDRSAFVSEDRVCHFWVCSHCGHEFETFSDLKPALPASVVEAFMPSLLVA